MALVNPHGGGNLNPLLLEGPALKTELEKAKKLTQVKVSSREKGDIIMLGIGGFTPLDGFMTYADWQGVCDGMKMANGLFWPIPITLSVSQSAADSIKTGQEIALTDPENGEAAGNHVGHREVHHRQGARVRHGVQDNRPQTPRRQDGDGTR